MSFGEARVNATGLVDQKHGCVNSDRRTVQPDLTFLPVPTTYAVLRRLASNTYSLTENWRP